MDDKERDALSAVEQLETSLEMPARLVAAYYKHLLANGFDSPQALALAANYQAWLFAQGAANGH